MRRTLLLLLAWCGCSSEAAAVPGVEADAANTADAADTAIIDSDFEPLPVRRLPCVGREALAADLPPETMGALEGELVSLVPPGTKGCPADPTHLHLQVLVGDKRYDVAVTLDTDLSPPLAIHVQKRPPVALPSPGWSTSTFDYERDLGARSTDYQPQTPPALLARLQSELASAARVQIYGRSYGDGTGVHNVHRNGRDRDGVILVHRVEPGGGDRAIALRFENQVF